MNNLKQCIVLAVAIAMACSGCYNKKKDWTSESGDSTSNSMGTIREANADINSDFASDVAIDNYNEIEMAGVAEEKADNPEVKAVAQMIESDHTKALKELEELSKNKKITLPDKPARNLQQKIDQLGVEASDGNFDEAWCKDMVDAHEKAIKKFEDYVNVATDAELKNWALQTLPTLRKHLEKVEACEGALGMK